VGPHPAVATTRSAVRGALAELAGETVLVACSGGADSLALAAAAAFVGTRSGLRVGAVTVDHGLQDGSADRAGHVAEQLRGLGLDPVEAVRVTVGTAGGPEAAARVARYRALDAAADAYGAAAVLLGHTADDQAETVLLGLARGSGPRSLAGMAPVVGRYRRPFLGLPRDVVRRACHEAGLTAWEDPHNSDPAFSRARVRSAALPALEEALGPGVAAALARTAALLRADADALDAVAVAAAERCRREGGLDLAELAGLPEAIRTRLLRRTAVAAGCPAGALSAGHVAALARLCVGGGVGPLHLPGGLRAKRSCGTLVLFRPTTVPPPTNESP
jgi:tRNA(Ile)-lysidine synthase